MFIQIGALGHRGVRRSNCKPLRIQSLFACTRVIGTDTAAPSHARRGGSIAADIPSFWRWSRNIRSPAFFGIFRRIDQVLPKAIGKHLCADLMANSLGFWPSDFIFVVVPSLPGHWWGLTRDAVLQLGADLTLTRGARGAIGWRGGARDRPATHR